MRDPALVLGESVRASLREMVREIVRRKPGGHLVEDRLHAITVSLPLIATERQEEAAAFPRDLLAAIERQIDAAIEAAAAFQPGQAFCHRCAAAACDHSRPPTSRHVFIGYGATGVPCWREFAQHCLELRHAEVDRLFEEPPAFITFLQGRSELHAALLPPFQSGGRELLGQVIAGFFNLPTRAGEGRGVLALTLQAVASGGAGGRSRIGLNLLGTGPDGSDLALLWERQQDLPWRRAVRWTQAALSSLDRPGSRHSGGRGPALEHRVMGILQGLARRLEQDVKGRTRRTAHADERHETGERPTRMALEDIKGARPEAFLLDERSGAFVVLGGRGRTHFFSPEGRLVSSARYSRDAVERKKKQGVWRALGSDVARTLRDSVLRASPGAPAP
ncbi:MAG TPA: hypothetical protein VFB95_11095 [Candidatus Cryosericum sp.]|nr:hypothetical protein [Candidatus Cryosericum sp.]